MREFVFIANYQIENDYLYNDFLRNDRLHMCYAKFDRYRVALIKILKSMHLRDSNLAELLYFHRIMRKEFMPKKLKSDNPVFIVTGRIYELYGKQLIRHLRHEYPNAIIVLYILDMIYSMAFRIENSKNDFDCIFSFDRGDAEKYALNFLMEPFSIGKIDELRGIKDTKYDVTFVGHAKNRYERIINIYETLSSHNLKLDFHIVGVPRNKRRYSTQIDYGLLPFNEVLIHVAQSRCVLEMVQNEEYSATTRYSEAMLLGKNLLTDCPAFQDEKNRENNIFWFHTADDIPFHEITIQHEYNLNKYEELLSINKFVSNIEQVIERSKND